MKNISTYPQTLMVIFFSLFVIGFFSPGSKGKPISSPEELLKKADQCRKSLIQSKSRMKYRHNWLNCINRYQRIVKSFPQSDQAAWALYHSAGMYTSLYGYSRLGSDLDEAINLYSELVGKYEKHRLADDGQYKIGDIYYRYKKDPTRAYVEFLKVDIKFPKGDMRPKARKKLDELASIIGEKESPKHEEKSSSSTNDRVKVNDIRYWSTPTYTRVVVDVDNPVKYETHLLKQDSKSQKPRRLYVDLKMAFVGQDIESSIPIKDGLLQRARAGQYDPETVRVVLDINKIGGYKTFHLYDPFRIVVDVSSIDREKAEEKEQKKIQTRTARKGVQKSKQPDKNLSLARQLGLTVKTIVIDPGHGGKDPGCLLPGGIKEKDIVLKLGMALAEKIREKIGCEVYLTREKDEFLSLEQRTAFANVKKADLFISLHINAHRQKGIYGLETYFLNMATDKQAVMVAARENATSEKNISDLETILNSLMLNTKINESSRLAHEVQNGMVGSVKKSYSKIKSLGVKQAPFYVLIGAEMPAILVETGFITNPTEKQRLLSPPYRAKLAEGITDGIDEYIKSIEEVYTGG